MQTTSFEQLARLLAHLRSRMGAEILEARDDLDGSIVVDVRLDVGRVIAAHRTIVRERVKDTVGHSRELVDRSRQLSDRAGALLTELRDTNSSRREHLDDTRRQVQVVRALRRDHAQLVSAIGAAGGRPFGRSAR